MGYQQIHFLSKKWGRSPNRGTLNLRLLCNVNFCYWFQLRNSGPGVPEYKCKRCTCAFFVYSGIELHLQCHLSEGNELRCFICGFHNHKLAMQWRIMRYDLGCDLGRCISV